MNESLFELFHTNTRYTRTGFSAHAVNIRRHLCSAQAVQAMSRNFKIYRFVDRSALPAPCLPELPLSLVLQRRESSRSFSGAEMSLEDLASILIPAAACNRVAKVKDHPQIELHFRPYPSGGAEYPLELYAILLRISGAPVCITHFDPRARTLDILKTSVSPASIENALIDAEPILETATALLAITAVFERTTDKYGDRGYRLVLLEAGHLAQNLCLTATAAGFGTLPWGGFFDDELNRLLDIDGLTEAVIHCIFLGVPGAAAPAAGRDGPP